MGEHSAIEWTDATVNFWWGCTKVSPACDFCYAETWSKRTGGANLWGVGAPRRKIKGAVALIRKLNAGPSKRVFIQSMSDLFDNEVPLEWFGEAWAEIKAATNLKIQIVTKRISIVQKRLAAIGEATWPDHVGLMVSVCNQPEADRDVIRLLELATVLGIPWTGVSAEPLLGHISFRSLYHGDTITDALDGISEKGVIDAGDRMVAINPTYLNHAKLDLIIAGGESGPGARPMHPDWARSIRDQCAAAGTAFHFKQFGAWAPSSADEWAQDNGSHQHCFWTGSRWSDTLGDYMLAGNCQMMRLVGKKRSGRLLDGREWNEFPKEL